MSGEAILEAIRTSMTERGYPPSQRELARTFGWSLGKVNDQLNRLVEEGRIVKGPGARTIRIIEGETQ